jgi:shikimate kinase
MRIYLIGYMGSGKTTLGQELAAKLELSFIDLDKYIEERNYKTVPQLFSEFGEEAFRQRERKALEEVSEFTNVVVATGGGAPCFFDNMELMNRTGITLFLDMDIPTLVERLQKSKTDRPLIRGKSKEELIGLIYEMMQKRLPYYEQAQIRISYTDSLLENVLILIQKKMKKNEKNPQK